MDKYTLCRNFLADPSKDPKNGHTLQKGKGPQRKYIKMCQTIPEFKDQIDKLIIDVSSQPRPKSHKKKVVAKSQPGQRSPKKLEIHGKRRCRHKIARICRQ
jgi:hypothetical protein